MHGAALVLLDGMGLGAGLSPQSVARLRKACAKALKDQVCKAERYGVGVRLLFVGSKW